MTGLAVTCKVGGGAAGIHTRMLPPKPTAEPGLFSPPSSALLLYHGRPAAKTHSFFLFGHVGVKNMDMIRYPTRNSFESKWRRPSRVRSLRASASALTYGVRKDLVNQVCEAIQSERWEDSEEELMKSIAHDLNPEIVMQVLKRERDAQNALRFFQWMDKQRAYEHHSDVYGTMIEILGEAKMFEEIESLVQQMSSMRCEVTMSILNSLIRLYGLNSRVKKALSFFDLIKDGGHVPPVSSYNTTIQVLLHNKKFNTVENMFIDMCGNGVSPNKKTYNLMIQCMCKKGKLDEALSLLNGMIESGSNPDVINYTMVISCFCRRGRMEQAFTIFERMQENSCEPNILTYNSMIVGLCTVGKLEKAVEWLSMIKNKGCEPNIYTYTVLLDNLCKVGRLDEAKEIFNEALIGGITPTVVTYNALINGYCKQGKLNEAIHLLEEMTTQECIPDKFTCSSIIHALLNGRGLPEAVKMHDEMANRGYKVGLQTSVFLFRQLCKEPNTKDAARLFEIIQKNRQGKSAPNYYYLIHAYVKVGEMERAYAFLHEMMRNGITPNLVTCNTLVKEYCRQKRLDDALKMLDFMMENGIDPNDVTYNILIRAHHKIGRIEGVKLLYQEALKRGVVPSQMLELHSEVPFEKPVLNFGDTLGLPERVV